MKHLKELLTLTEGWKNLKESVLNLTVAQERAIADEIGDILGHDVEVSHVSYYNEIYTAHFTYFDENKKEIHRAMKFKGLVGDHDVKDFKRVDEGLNEAKNVKAFKLKVPSYCTATEDEIFGEEDGDDSFIQNQNIVTVEYVDLKGKTLYVYPLYGDANDENTWKKLQSAFDEWCSSTQIDESKAYGQNILWKKLEQYAEECHGEFGLSTIDEDAMKQVIFIAKANKIARDVYGETGFSTLSDSDKQHLIQHHPEVVKVAALERALKDMAEDTGE